MFNKPFISCHLHTHPYPQPLDEETRDLIDARAGGRGQRSQLGFQTLELGLPEADFARREDPGILERIREEHAAALEAAGTERPDIVFLGDASTQNGRYPEKFRQRVEKAHAPHRLAVANLGIHASSTSQGRVLLERDALPLRPRSVAFYYGWTDHFLGLGDDEILRIGQARRSPLHQLRLVQFLGQRDLESLRAARSDTSRRVPKENFEENLRVMVRSARDNGTIPILLTAPTAFRPGRTPDALRGFYISETDDLALLHAEYADVVRSVAEEEDVVFCDLHAHFDRMHPKQAASHFIAGIHPNPTGDARIARMLYECLETAGELNALLN